MTINFHLFIVKVEVQYLVQKVEGTGTLRTRVNYAYELQLAGGRHRQSYAPSKFLNTAEAASSQAECPSQ